MSGVQAATSSPPEHGCPMGENISAIQTRRAARSSFSMDDGRTGTVPVSTVTVIARRRCRRIMVPHIQRPTRAKKATQRAALNSIAHKIASTPPNTGRNNELNNGAFTMGHMVASGWIAHATVEARLFDAATTCGLVQDDGQRSVLATINGIDAGGKEPHAPLANREEYCGPNDAEPFNEGSPKFRHGKPSGSSGSFEGSDVNQKRTTLQSARASTYKMEAIDWLWPNRFALGKLGLIVGLPEEGKGQLLCYIAAQVTSANGQWPCDEGAATMATSSCLLPRIILATQSCRDSPLLVPIWNASRLSRWFAPVTTKECSV